ncbi:MAG: peptidase M20, partial [Verrucomicrobia bacterium]|nr:peptidase M20 [Verrucomicrobiota bacterium]
MQLVLDYLAQNEDRFLRELCDYLRFPSVSAQPDHRADLESCARWITGHCHEIGLEAELCETPGHPIVLART